MRSFFVCVIFGFYPMIAAALDRQGTNLFHVYERPDNRPSISRVADTFGLTNTTKQFAIVVGVGEYEDDHFDRLPGAKRDALRVYDYLTEIGGFDRVWLLTNQEATKSRLESIMLDELREQATEDDRVLFYYTGHGVSRTFGDASRGFLPLSKSRRNSLSSMISMRDIEEWADSLQHVHQLFFVLDSCVSGLAGDLTMSGLNPEIERDLNRRGHHLLTAGTGEQLAYATNDGSYFTRAFLDGIQGAADAAFASRSADGAVSVSELTLYVRQRLRQDLDDRDWLMTPQQTILNRERRGEFFFTSLEQFQEVPIGGAEIQQGEDTSPENVDEPESTTTFELDLSAVIPPHLSTDNIEVEQPDSDFGFLPTRSFLLIKDLQGLLTSNACEPRGVDGIYGPNTQSAMARYNLYKPENCSSLDLQTLSSLGIIPSDAELEILNSNVEKIRSCNAIACEEYRPQPVIGFASRNEYRSRFYEVGDGRFYTIVFSSTSKEEAENKILEINTNFPNFYAYLYPPLGSNPNWAVMIASKTTREKAVEAMQLARSSGIAIDAFVWPR